MYYVLFYVDSVKCKPQSTVNCIESVTVDNFKLVQNLLCSAENFSY